MSRLTDIRSGIVDYGLGIAAIAHHMWWEEEGKKNKLSHVR